jgi:hypothetical protein
MTGRTGRASRVELVGEVGVKNVWQESKLKKEQRQIGTHEKVTQEETHGTTAREAIVEVEEEGEAGVEFWIRVVDIFRRRGVRQRRRGPSA